MSFGWDFDAPKTGEGSGDASQTAQATEVIRVITPPRTALEFKVRLPSKWSLDIRKNIKLENHNLLVLSVNNISSKVSNIAFLGRTLLSYVEGCPNSSGSMILIDGDYRKGKSNYELINNVATIQIIDNGNKVYDFWSNVFDRRKQ